jgi:hypothetical protein
MSKYTKDPVEALLTKIISFYQICIKHGEKFEGKNEYEVVKEITNVIEYNNKPQRSKAVLKVVK